MREYRPRSDGLPEGTEYRDTGCDIAPSCLRCPLEACRYDRPNGMQTIRAEFNAAEAQRLRESGMNVSRIAEELGLTLRQIYRLLAGAKGRGDD